MPAPLRPHLQGSGLFRRAVLLSALLAGPVLAQGGGQLPLVSVGDGLKWNQPQELYRIVVAEGSAARPLNLEVYSPALNLTDSEGRRAAGAYGDELYSQGRPFETTFTLSGPGGVVFERRYQTSRDHGWESLYAGTLAPGNYSLRVSSRGNGKNAFGLRVAGGFALESSDFSVNARRQEGPPLPAARLTVPAAWIGRTIELSNYDGDGAAELALSLALPGGGRRPLTVSADVAPAVDRVTVTRELVGEWAILAQVPPGARQQSNALTLRLRLDGVPVPARVGGFDPPAGATLAPGLAVEVVDPQGRAIPGATYTVGGDGVVRPRLPSGYAPVSASVLTGRGTPLSPTELRVESGGGAGAEARLRFVARPLEGGLSVDAVAVFGTARLPLSGVQAEVNGRTVTLPANVPLPPGEYPVKPGPVPGAGAQPLVGRVTDAQTGRVTLEYQVRADLSLLTSPDLLNACDVAQLVATARTDFPYKLPVSLKVNLPAGWTSDYPLEARGDLVAGTPLRVKVPVRVCRTDSADAVLSPIDLHAGGAASVRNPAGANLTRAVAGGARVRLAKTAQAATSGYAITLALTVEGTVENLRLLDPLPTGGGTPAVRGPLNLQGPGAADLNPRVEGDSVVLGRLGPGQYTVNYVLFTDLPPERVLTAPDVGW